MAPKASFNSPHLAKAVGADILEGALSHLTKAFRRPLPDDAAIYAFRGADRLWQLAEGSRSTWSATVGVKNTPSSKRANWRLTASPTSSAATGKSGSFCLRGYGDASIFSLKGEPELR